MSEEKNKKLLEESLSKKFNEETLRPVPDDALTIFNDGCSCIVTDDSCYVIKNWVLGKWVNSSHIFKEAVEELKKLPDNPRDTYEPAE